MSISRRTFLAGLAAGAPAILRAQPRSDRLPLSFSTLGCPAWPWRRIVEQAAAMGYAAIELRGIEMKMDLPARPEFTGTRLADSRKDLDALGLKISDLGASSRMHEADPKVRRALSSTRDGASSISRSSCASPTSVSSATASRQSSRAPKSWRA